MPDPTHVAFVRAINVRGHKIIAMQDLTRAFAASGCADVKSIIQSGNVLFTPRAANAAELERVRHAVQHQLGGEIVMMFRTLRAIQQLVHADPFQHFARQRGLKRYVAFLERSPRPAPHFPLRSAKERLEAIAMRGREAFIVSGRKPSGFYGFPNNFIEEALGVRATTRNWSTIVKISALAR